MLYQLSGWRVVAFRLFDLAAFPELVQIAQVRNDRFHVNTEIYQAGNFIHAGQLQAVDHLQTSFRCSEQTARLVVTIEGMSQEGLEIIGGQLSVKLLSQTAKQVFGKVE